MMQGENATPNSGKHSFDPIKSPKETETIVIKTTGPTAPAGAEKPPHGR